MALSARGILFSHLKPLEKKELQDFKTLLKMYPPEDAQSAKPRRHGKKPAYIETADKMIRDYKEERAFAIAADLLHQVNRKDLSVPLLQCSQQYLDEKRTANEAKLNHRKRYLQNVREQLRLLEEKHNPRGQRFYLKDRHTRLQAVQYWQEKKRGHEMIVTGRKHLETKSYGAANYKLDTDKLFESDERGKIPRIIVLQGAAGIGKTTTVRRIVHDWVSGDLFQDRFEYVVYINCRDIMKISGQQTMADLLLDNYLKILEPTTRLILDTKKLLFIIDGFDELKCTLNRRESGQKEMTSKESKEIHFLRKRIVNESYIIITTRHTALKELSRFMSIQQYVEILGFSQDDRQEYFRRFFENKTLEMEAFHFAQKNEILHTMCFVPTVCWIFCTVAKQQMEKCQHLTDVSGTSTSTYMLFLNSLLKSQSSDLVPHLHNNLKKLCTLAKEGTLQKKIHFEEDDIVKQGLVLLDVQPLFLANDVLINETDRHLYSFIHLSFQEFLAALFYVLRDNEDITESKESLQELINLLAICREQKQGHLTLMVRFLFGLLNKDLLYQMEKSYGWRISSEIRPALLKWITEEIRHGSAGNTEELMDLFYCMYEIQDEEFARSVMEHFANADIGRFKEHINQLDFRMFLYCLKFADKIQNLFISYFTMEHKDLKDLMPWILSCSGLKLKECSITDSLCNVSANGSVAELNLDNNGLGVSGVQLLCEGLKDPGCKLQKLQLNRCSLTDSCCADLRSMVRASPALKELSLSNNKLKDSGVRELCEGLKHPDCRVQRLCLDSCSLTASCCADLSHVFSASVSLTDLELSYNELEDSGVKKLCEGLKHPNCKIQKLSLESCSLTEACCKDLSIVLASHQSLRELSLSLNHLGDSGVTQLCNGLKHPECTIQKLRLAWCAFTGSCLEELVSVLKSHRHLTELDIGGNRLVDHEVGQLCERLKHQACFLKTLVLSHNSLTEVCCGYLLSVLLANHSLTDLQLRSAFLEDSGVIQLCETLKQPECKMRKLDLDMTSLTDAGIPDLCTALCINREIQKLSLRWNSITDLSVASFTQLIQTSVNLTDLRLSGNQFSSQKRKEMKLLMKERAWAELFDFDTETTEEW